MINRYQLDYAKDRLFKGKALIIYGPRQVGKTTFVELLLKKEASNKILRLNGDDADTRSLLASPNLNMLQALIGEKKILFIDEAQRISNIGVLIKIVVDRVKDVQVIATGSSSFELANHINEPLTGRKYEMLLLPLAYQELVSNSDFLTESRQTEQRLIYGSYPEIITNPTDAMEHLKLLAESYLYKDLFTLDKINKPQLLQKIVRALALQVGSEVSVTEIGRLVSADNKTVEKYITLLEMAFVIFTLPALSRNVRNEIKKGRKIYFYDNGILNAVSGNFMPLQNRKDVGALWENYLVSERIKSQHFQRGQFSNYFWRTTQQQEIDFIEETTQGLSAFEFKWNDKAKSKFSATFLNAYPNAKTMVITPQNRNDFLTLSPQS
tara:strand:- start:21115 stop:22257 length:1143 start_codon:yes stop_codon:yes gene_type:complete